MRCKACDYPLWSIRARQCPECGTPFVPSDFEFTPNSVQFRCPHCEQPFYGTDAHGHLVPRSFTCVSCGEPVDMDEMVLLPTAGVDERRTTASILPWLDPRKKRTRAWRTIGLAMVQPRRMMDITPVESSVGRAWWFYALVIVLTSLLSGVGLFLFGIGGGRGLATGLLVGVAALLVAVFGWMLLWGTVAHALMKVLGARPRYSIGRTYQALCYSSGVMIPGAIPCVGFYLLPVTTIWWTVSAALAAPRAQGARPVRGAAAVAALPVLTYAGVVALIVWAIAFAFASIGPGVHTNALSVYQALSAYSHTNGVAPEHGAQVLADGSLTWFELNDPLQAPMPAQSIAGMPIAQWQSLGSPDQLRVAKAMGAALAPDWAAHRLGNVVFTYHGINLDSPQDPGLWVFLFWPDAPATPQTVSVMHADGTPERMDIADFRRELVAQNRLRVRFGLLPIPDPGTVREVAVNPSVWGGP